MGSRTPPRAAGFTHRLTPPALPACARVLLTVSGADFSVSDELSPVIQSAFPRVVRMVLRWLEQKDKLPRDRGPI